MVIHDRKNYRAISIMFGWGFGNIGNVGGGGGGGFFGLGVTVRRKNGCVFILFRDQVTSSRSITATRRLS